MRPTGTKTIATFSPGIARLPSLRAILEVEQVRLRPWRATSEIDAVVGWGQKSNTRLAVAYARTHSLPFLRLEDGFLRSVGLGDSDPPLSMVVDDLGVYYDARGSSRLEVSAAAERSSAERDRARALVGLWRSGRVSKYNHAREAPPPVDGPFVLVVDQTHGDSSIRCGLADEASFERMLEGALDEHPDLPVVLKVHPEVVSGRKRGHYGSLSPRMRERVVVLGIDAHVPALLEAAHAVYTVTSQVGFEALLWGKPVRCFGMPFYAGWGLTEDALRAPERRRPIALESLVHAALVDYPRYLDPETGARCEPERLLEWIALQRRMRERFSPEVHGLGFSRWKKPIVRAFFQGSDVRFVERLGDVPRDATLAVWGQRSVPEGRCRSVVRLEDGFLRSVGLGADLVRPLSWVLDAEGMYYDATSPSGLETILATTDFDEQLVARARALRERIAAAGVTKYNVGHGRWERPSGTSRVVLVPGQVESDASLAYGSAGIRTNVELLRAAREAAPSAYLVYKPHPDVVAHLRAQGAGENRASAYCDEVVVDVPMDDLLHAVDEVHVLTSLAGFEALLRGREVVTHGRPFYAGWGLTRDMAPLPRRGRSLTLDELVAGVLVLYPTYVSRTTGRFTTPERTLDELLEWRAETRASTPPPWRKALRWALRALKR